MRVRSFDCGRRFFSDQRFRAAMTVVPWSVPFMGRAGATLGLVG
jgi:hypothetical protein